VQKIKTLIITLVAVIAILLLISFRQFQRNEQYREHNRELLLQNDSIISINIELKDELKEYKQIPYSVNGQKKESPHGK
jgi:hypothetical protein